MDFQEFILTYRGKTKDGSDGIVANIPDYYDYIVSTYSNAFKEYKLNGGKLVICPLHNDTDPSFGLIPHRFLKGVKIYHCFGCNASGTIIRLHQRIVAKYEKREITEKESCVELAKIFNIPFEEYKDSEVEDYEKRYINTLKSLDILKESYTYSDFIYDVRDARKSDSSEVLKKLNSASVKLIATKKQLYN